MASTVELAALILRSAAAWGLLDSGVGLPQAAGVNVNEFLKQLRTGDEFWRHHAAVALAMAEPTPEVLEALVEALSDPGSYETPGDYDAPPFHYSVSYAAYEALKGRSAPVFESLARKMAGSAQAAQLGLQLLADSGEQGLPLLLIALEHPDDEVRKVAVRQVRPMLARLGEPSRELLGAKLLDALRDAGPGITYAALQEVGYLVKERPELEPVRLARPGLVEALIERMRAQPAASTYAEVLGFFGSRDDVLAAWVELAAAGTGFPSRLLKPHLDRLSDSQAERLARGAKNAGTIPLLAQLGARARAAVPELLNLLGEPQLGVVAAVALQQIPGAEGAPLHLWADYFLKNRDARPGILRHHPEPARLAREVLPHLRERWQQHQDIEALRALEVLGPLAVSELPWLLPLLEPYKPSIPCVAALDVISTFGEAARPAFDKIAWLLNAHDSRGSALNALARLGPVAADTFLPLLEAMKVESERWGVWQKNNWPGPLARALASLRQSGPAPR